jgi:hypothetical protein
MPEKPRRKKSAKVLHWAAIPNVVGAIGPGYGSLTVAAGGALELVILRGVAENVLLDNDPLVVDVPIH